MTNNRLFSIIIPTYNRAAFLSNTLKSVLKQRHSDFEVIIVDDGSTDNTEHVVSSFNDLRIAYYKKNNAERAAARNFGISKSSGKYITFLDSDDVFKDNHLQVAYEFILQYPDVEIFHLGYDVVDDEGLIQYPWKKMPDPINGKLIEGNFLSCLGVFVKREIFDSVRFNEDVELSGSEDYELWIRIAARYPIRTLFVSTAQLVNHDLRSVLEIDVLKFKKRISLFKHYVLADNKVCEKYSRSDLRIMFAYKNLYAALHFSISSNKTIGWHYLARAFMAHPLMIGNYRFWIVVKKLILF